MRPILAAAVTLALLAPLPGSAQINPFRTRSADRLSNADFQLLMQASDALLARPTLAAGESETWKNAQTGSFGSVSVSNTTHRKGMLCHALDYESQSGAGVSSRTGTLVWCKTAQGWKIAS